MLAKQANLRVRSGPAYRGDTPPLTLLLASRGKYHEPHNNQERLTLYWACDACIRERRAITANPSAQRWMDCEPYLAYFDEERECRDCKGTFTFPKEKQHHWYEVLRFWVWSRPVRCPACNDRHHGRHA
jgi:hypothetical protein